MSKKGQISNFLLIIISLILALLIFQFIGLSPRIVIAVLMLAVFLIAFVNTDFALIILIFSMLLSPELKLAGIPGRAVVLRVDDILLFVVFFGWLAKMAVHKELGLLRTTPLNRPIIAYILICLLSTAIGGLQGTTDPKHGVFYILKYIEYFIIFFMVSNNIRDKKQVKIFLSFMLLTSFIVTIYALTTLVTRATAPFDEEPNTLAGYLLLMMGIALGLFLYLRPLKLRLLFGGYFAFLTVPFLYTLSRAGWLGFFPVYITSLVLSRRNKEILILLLLTGVIAAPSVLPQTVRSRVQRTFIPGARSRLLGDNIPLDDSAAARIISWKGALVTLTKRPILGRGVPGGGAAVLDVQYTRVLRETGITGFLVFIWIMVTLFKISWRSFSDPNVDNLGRGLSLGFMCSLAGLLTMGVAAEVFIIVRIMEPFWFLAAIVAMLPEISAASEEGIPDVLPSSENRVCPVC